MSFSKHTILFLFLSLFLAGCFLGINEKIEVTQEYIINPNWDEQANAIKIQKMKVVDSGLIKLDNLNQTDILEGLKEDSSFVYVANVKAREDENYSKRKVYFNKDNGFDWWQYGGNSKSKTIGDLERGSWYKISHLVTYPYYIYVYIDSANNIHRQDVNQANY